MPLSEYIFLKYLFGFFLLSFSSSSEPESHTPSAQNDSPVVYTSPINALDSLQPDHPYCATTTINAILAQRNPGIASKRKILDQQIAELSKNAESQRSSADYILPVVVNIVHNNGSENIGDSQIQQGIENLNLAFENIGFFDRDVGVNTGIQFCLASRAPDGTPNSGINRIASSLTDHELFYEGDTLKSLLNWPTTDYIQIWVVKSIELLGDPGIVGYATLPYAHGQRSDGIVVEYWLFDRQPEAISILAHEMGHYLGLYHTFEGGCKNDDCLLDGDRICDTPPDGTSAGVPCSATVNSCDTDISSGFTTDQDDQTWNYMDYNSHHCLTGFTEGQKNRMHHVISSVRSSLQVSDACNNPCPSLITSGFTIDQSEIVAGETISFTNKSQNFTSATWYIDGTEVSQSSSGFDYVFNQTGLHTITLELSNAHPECDNNYSIDVNVLCNVEASFSYAPTSPGLSESIQFTNASDNASQYEWTINGISAGTNQNLNHAFNAPGIYRVCMEASNTICSNQFCQNLTIQDLSDTCKDQTFVLRIGDENNEERGSCIVPSQDGNLLFAGTRNDSTLLIKFSVDGDVLWKKQIKFSQTDSRILDLYVDSDGNLLGSGRSATGTAAVTSFAFKVNTTNGAIIWSRVFPNNIQIAQILETSNGSNYFLIGEIRTTEDVIIRELDRNDGSFTGNIEKQYNLNGSETIRSTLLHNGALYSIGRYNYTRPTGGMRSALSMYDLDGNQQFTRLSHVETGKNARLYGRSVLYHNNQIYCTSAGDDDGISLQNTALFLYSYTESGNLNWVVKYDLADYDSEFLLDADITTDGIVFHAYSHNVNHGFYIFKTDFDGNVLWGKEYLSQFTNTSYAFDKSLVVTNDFIYIVGTSIDLGGNADAVIIKCDRDGNLETECSQDVGINITQTMVQDPKNLVYSLNEPLQEVLSNNQWSSQSNQAHVPIEELCPKECPQEICDNLIDDDGDGLIDCLDTIDCPTINLSIASTTPICTGGGQFVITTVCNAGPLALAGPICMALYDGDPTSNSDAQLVDTLWYDLTILNGQCITLNVHLSETMDYGMLVVNDNGSISPIIDPVSDFPSTDSIECDYLDNMASFDFSNIGIAPSLDLGQDITICENQVVSFDAGPDWVEYRWQDGSMEQHFSSSGPGLYFVNTTDSCGNQYSDSVYVYLDPLPSLNLGPDLEACPEDTLSLIITGYSEIQWFTDGNSTLSCTDCSNPNIIPTSETEIIAVASSGVCYTTDTLNISLDLVVTSYNTVRICPGDSTEVFDAYQSDPGIYIRIDTSNHCMRMDTVEVIVDSLGTIDASIIHPQCYGESTGAINIMAETSLMYKLISVNASQELDRTDSLPAGKYHLIVENEFGCTSEYFLDLVDTPQFNISLPLDQTLVIGDSLQIHTASNQSVLSYTWNDTSTLSCVNCPNPIASPIEHTNYIVEAVSTNGCIDSDSIFIKVKIEDNIFVPTAFSPNDDGINDRLLIFTGKSITSIHEFHIYDRWGACVYSDKHIALNNSDRGWDGLVQGKKAQEGVYVWWANVSIGDGSNRIIKGSTTLIR